MTFLKSANKGDITLKTQFVRIIVSHIKASVFLSIILGLCLLSLWLTDIGKKILCVLIPVVYSFYMASAGKKISTHDLKSYAKTKPFALKGFMLSLPILIFNLIFWLIFKISWVDNGNLLSVLAKLVFYVWSFPVTSFVYIKGATMDLICHILLYTLPFLSVGIGYFTGYKKWDVSKVFYSITFEKKQ